MSQDISLEINLCLLSQINYEYQTFLSQNFPSLDYKNYIAILTNDPYLLVYFGFNQWRADGGK
jgi:hypothetical protein